LFEQDLKHNTQISLLLELTKKIKKYILKIS
jgi:hypothetical protein